jgi:hypothetical protein
LLNAPEDCRDAIQNRHWDEAISILKSHDSEAAYAFEGATGNAFRLGDHLERDYGEYRRTCIVGAADYVLTSRDRVEVVDLKTGNAPVSARNNWQLRGLAVAAALAHSKHAARIVVLTIQENRACRWESVDVDALQIAEDALYLQGLYAAASRADEAYALGADLPELKFGRHCKHCPARTHCPKYADEAQSLLAAPKPRLALPLATREEKRIAYHQIRMAEAMIAELKRQLVSQAMIEPIEVSPGTLYGPREVSREVVDARTAETILSMLYGPEVAHRGIEPSTNKTRIKAALQLRAEQTQTQYAIIEREFYKALRAAQGVSPRVQTRVEEYAGDLPPATLDELRR